MMYYYFTRPSVLAREYTGNELTPPPKQSLPCRRCGIKRWRLQRSGDRGEVSSCDGGVYRRTVYTVTDAAHKTYKIRSEYHCYSRRISFVSPPRDRTFIYLFFIHIYIYINRVYLYTY